MEVNKYGQRTLAESAAIWVQEILLVSTVACVAAFAINVAYERIETAQTHARIELQSERAENFLSGQAAR